MSECQFLITPFQGYSNIVNESAYVFLITISYKSIGTIKDIKEANTRFLRSRQISQCQIGQNLYSLRLFHSTRTLKLTQALPVSKELWETEKKSMREIQGCSTLSLNISSTNLAFYLSFNFYSSEDLFTLNLPFHQLENMNKAPALSHPKGTLLNKKAIISSQS